MAAGSRPLFHPSTMKTLLRPTAKRLIRIPPSSRRPFVHSTILRSQNTPKHPAPNHQSPTPLTRLLTRLPSFSTLRPLIRLPLLTFLTLLTWLPVVWFLHTHIFAFMRVTGPSMYPFLNTDWNTSTRKDVVGVWMWGAGEEVRRGEIVVFRSPVHPETIVVKRVIAIEGDTVITRPPYPLPRQDVSLGHVWVEGEHPEHTRWSYDSNSYGAVSATSI